MGRSVPYDWGTGIGTNIIGAGVLGIVAIVWKCIKARRNISRGQPENPVAGEQFVMDMTSSGPPTSSPFSSPTSPAPSFGNLRPTRRKPNSTPSFGNPRPTWRKPNSTPSFGNLSPTRSNLCEEPATEICETNINAFAGAPTEITR